VEAGEARVQTGFLKQTKLLQLMWMDFCERAVLVQAENVEQLVRIHLTACTRRLKQCREELIRNISCHGVEIVLKMCSFLLYTYKHTYTHFIRPEVLYSGSDDDLQSKSYTHTTHSNKKKQLAI